MVNRSAFEAHLVPLYGEAVARATCQRLCALVDRFRSASPLALAQGSAPRPEARREGGLTERDAILITYADQVREPGVPPLRSLGSFCQRHVRGLVSGLHVLPFYPSSSDDGFAVIDYRSVDPALGSWEDVAGLRTDFRLMFDAVVNHVSSSSAWYQRFLQDDPRYRDYFIVVPEGTDLSQVVRPRALQLLTQFTTPSGEKAVWTTFSADQIDLNYHNPDVLLEIIDTLLFYVAHGAEFMRLDAIAYLWKEPGTTCIHLPQAHHIIQLFRAVLDAVAPGVALITETNVPHSENISYWGDGRNEAQAVYNFALPPLILHSFHTGTATALSQWAGELTLPSDRVTFLNFLASHDGIGLNPVRGILSPAEIDALVQRTLAHGGLVSYKSNPDGTRSPYELNVNYLDALSSPSRGESLDVQVERFATAHAMMLALVGLPGIYFHSLFGSRGWPEGAAASGHNRTLNRQKLTRAELEAELADPTSLRSRIYGRLERLLRARIAQPAFHPHGRQRVVECGETVLGVLRVAPNDNGRVLCLHNVSGRQQQVKLDLRDSLGIAADGLIELTSGRRVAVHEGMALTLHACQTLWLTRQNRAMSGTTPQTTNLAGGGAWLHR